MSDEKTFPLDDLMETLEERRANRTRSEKARDWVSGKLHRIPNGVRSASNSVHRARRGWSADDVWFLKGYLTRLVGEALLHLADNGMGYPVQYNGADDWRRDLRQHGRALRAYASADWEEEEDRIGDAQQALHWVADNLGDLWD